ncbi:MAG: TonB family protein [Pseudomonadota bacterium]
MAPLEPEEPAEVEETAPIKTVETATEVLEIIQPEIAIAVETTGATNVALPTSETEALPSTTPVDLTTALQPELETLTASEPDAPTTSLKPAVRSRAIEQAQQNPQPVRRQAAPSGNATQNAVRGSTTGTTTATAAQQSANRGNVAQEGNAAATNYPGVVMRKISGVPRPRVRASSVATVRFVIARAGGLNSVSIARSSGNSSLDAAALQVIRQAAPFPAPPPGAQRTFTIRIRGRG